MYMAGYINFVLLYATIRHKEQILPKNCKRIYPQHRGSLTFWGHSNYSPKLWSNVFSLMSLAFTHRRSHIHLNFIFHI